MNILCMQLSMHSGYFVSWRFSELRRCAILIEDFTEIINTHSKTNKKRIIFNFTNTTHVLHFHIKVLTQEQSVNVVTMLPLRSVTVLQCGLPELWNLLWVLVWCPSNENILSMSSNTSSNTPPPKELWKCLLCVSSWAWKRLSKCLLLWEWGFCPKTSNPLNKSSKLKLNGWRKWSPPPLVPFPENGLLLIWSYSCLRLSSDNVSYAVKKQQNHMFKRLCLTIRKEWGTSHDRHIIV